MEGNYMLETKSPPQALDDIFFLASLRQENKLRVVSVHEALELLNIPEVAYSPDVPS
jgi:hypothetical protein